MLPPHRTFGGVVALGMDDDILLGEREGWGSRLPVRLSVPDRRSHLYVIGQTGVGKSTLLTSLILQDIEAGRGVGILDPHGQLAEELLERIPRRRTDDVIYFDPGNLSRAPAFNLLEPAAADERPLIAAGVVSVMRHLWRNSWGPRSEYIAYCGVSALLDHSARRGGVSLLGLPRLFVDEDYRARVVRDCTNAKVRSFWEEEYPRYHDRLQSEAVAPLQNKLGAVLTTPALVNVLGQARSTIKPAEIMDTRKIFIGNLAKGRIGEEPARLLGGFLLTSFALAALARASIPEPDRVDFALALDEFQLFAASETLPSILSEARKYRLSLLLSHQYVLQLPEATRAAVFGNVGTMIAFRLGADDVRVISNHFAPFAESTLRELGRGEAIARVLRHGLASDPVFLTTLPPSEWRYGRHDNILRQSQQRYTRSRADVEEKIVRWLKVGGV